MRRDDRDRPRPRRRWPRRGVVAALAVVAGLGVVCAGASTQVGNITAPQTVSSESALTATHTTVHDATIVQTVTHVGQFVTAHRPTLAATAVSLLLPLFLVARRRPAIPVAVTAPRRFRGGTPLRRGPPTFLAR